MAVGESPRFVETNRPLVRPTDDVQLSKAFGSSHREPTEEDCLRYLQDYLAEAKQVPGLVGHTLIELRKRFPIDEARRLSEDDRVQKKGT